MLSAGEIDAMRSTVDDALPDQCVLNRLTRTPDGAGGWTDTWSAVATVACRVRPTNQNNASEPVTAERLQGRSPFTVTLPHDADVRDADTIQRVGDTTALEVIGVGVPESWSLCVRVQTARLSS